MEFRSPTVLDGGRYSGKLLDQIRYLLPLETGIDLRATSRNGPKDAEINAIAVASSGPSPNVWAGVIGLGRKGGVQRFSAGKWSAYPIAALTVWW